MLLSNLKIIFKNFKYKKLSVFVLSVHAILLGVMFGMLLTFIHSVETYETRMLDVTRDIVQMSLVQDGQEDETIKDLGAHYDFVYETTANKYVQSTSNLSADKVNVFARNKHELFELDQLVAGDFPQENNEITIGTGFAKTNNIKIGDVLQLDERDYHVVGLYQNPEQYVLFDLSKSTDIRLNHNMPVIVADVEDFGGDQEVEHVHYARVDTKTTKDLLMTEEVVSLTTIQLNIVNTLRTTNTQILFMTCSLILFIILASLFLQIKSVIQSNMSSFGVLISMGVKKAWIIWAYSSLGFVITMFMMLGFESGKIVANSFFEQIEGTYNMVIENVGFYFGAEVALLSYIGVFITFATFIYVSYMLNHSPLTMITNAGADKSTNKLVARITLKNVPFALRMQVKNMFGNFLTTTLIIASIFAAIFLFQFSTSLNMATDALIADYEDFIQFDAKSYYNATETEDKADEFFETKIKIGKNETKETSIDETLMMAAVDVSAGFLGFVDSDGERPKELAKDEIIMPSRFAEEHDIAAGDTIILFIEGTRLATKVALVNNVYLDEYVYTEKETVRDILREKYGVSLFNGAFKHDDDANFVIEKEQLLVSGETISDSIQAIVAVLVGFALLLFFMTMIMFSNFIIQKHNKEITLLIAEGYSKGAAGRTFVNYFNVLILVATMLLLCWNDQLLDVLSRYISESVRYKLVFPPNLTFVIGAMIGGITLYNTYLFMYYRWNREDNLEKILKMDE